MTVRVTSIGIIQTAKTLAALYALVGFIVGIGVFFAFLFAPAHSAFGAGLLRGLFALFLIPIAYAIVGFIAITIVAWTYNFVARKTGGVQFTTTVA